MIQKIGKYEIRGRIGRGGMGTVFRAHDPVLDRAVAIKVISDDVDVTEELRARFFREAQACAKLSHPNIVTIYDMGEEDGRLYIVMEFLEGEELRHLIAQRRYTALEDKVALMRQVCDGLHYAHQKGVIHRDIKPGNIIVLRDGVAKIVDFGIAHVATLGGGLTRTGLVMGTLRYISPEQARGRADHRSDMFSVGSVFYEFLAHRPALTGADPMHLLEQLRSEEPPVLAEVDPTIPLDLSAVIAKAMRKDPTERFADLGQMRLELENVQSRLGNDAAEVRRSINRKLERARHLQTVLAERIGTSASTVDLPVVEERARLDTPAVEFLLEAEGFYRRAFQAAQTIRRQQKDEATGAQDLAFQHRAAAARLDAATRSADLWQRAEGRMAEAESALTEGEYALAKQAFSEVGELFGRAERAARDAIQREELARDRDRVQRAETAMNARRAAAEMLEAARRAVSPWLAARDKGEVARLAFQEARYGEAVATFEQAATLYREAEASAREVVRQEEQAREREAVERARQGMAAARARASEVDAGRRATTHWGEAEAKSAEGRAALARGEYERTARAFEQADSLYGTAERITREAVRAEQARHEQRLVGASAGPHGPSSGPGRRRERGGDCR